MNIELLDRIATWLEAGAPHKVEGVDHPIHFDMNTFGAPNDNDCATACCIATAATQFTNTYTSAWVWDNLYMDPGFQKARELLDLDDARAEKLFFPTYNCDELINFEAITSVQAALTILNLIATGVVDWEV